MLEYLVKRIMGSVPTVIAVVFAVFFLIHIAPGDPIDILVGENASGVMKAKVVKEYALDKPLYTQALFFLKNVFIKGGGKSIYYGKRCFDLIAAKFVNTVFLGASAFFMAVFFSFLLSFVSFFYQGRLADRVITFFATIGMSLPSFWFGIILLIVFSVKLKLFPVSGTGGFYHVFLPALTLAVPMGSYVLHVLRGELIARKNSRFVLSLKARGVRDFLIYSKHVLKNALIPVVMVLALQTGFLLTGAIITETIFSWDGIGYLLITAINVRDYPLVQSLAIFIAVVYIYSNLFGDMVMAFMDRRITFEKRDL